MGLSKLQMILAGGLFAASVLLIVIGAVGSGASCGSDSLLGAGELGAGVGMLAMIVTGLIAQSIRNARSAALFVQILVWLLLVLAAVSASYALATDADCTDPSEAQTRLVGNIIVLSLSVLALVILTYYFVMKFKVRVMKASRRVFRPVR